MYQALITLIIRHNNPNNQALILVKLLLYQLRLPVVRFGPFYTIKTYSSPLVCQVLCICLTCELITRMCVTSC